MPARNLIDRFRPQSRIVVLLAAEDNARDCLLPKDPEDVQAWKLWHEYYLQSPIRRVDRILAKWSHDYPSLSIISQRIDGHLERAGAARVTEMNGNVHRLCCLCCKQKSGWSEIDEGTIDCVVCRASMRMDIVTKGERISEEMEVQITQQLSACNLYLAIGGDQHSLPAAGYSDVAKTFGAKVFHIQAEDLTFEFGASIGPKRGG